MKFVYVVLLASVLVGCSSAPPGSITGKITFEDSQRETRRIDISEDEECVKLNPDGLYDRSVVVNKDGTLSNVFVYIKNGLEAKKLDPPAEPVMLDQRGCQFTPRVLAVRAGQKITITNSDPVTHNVHPVAKMNREWNQSQAPGDAPLERKFVRPEVMIRVKCNIHNWMRSWVAVMDHPYFALSKADGSFDIPNVPPGDYTLEAWHEVLGTQEQPVHIDPSGKATLTFHFKASQ